jgi:hypothetical protein
MRNVAHDRQIARSSCSRRGPSVAVATVTPGSCTHLGQRRAVRATVASVVAALVHLVQTDRATVSWTGRAADAPPRTITSSGLAAGSRECEQARELIKVSYFYGPAS